MAEYNSKHGMPTKLIQTHTHTHAWKTPPVKSNQIECKTEDLEERRSKKQNPTERRIIKRKQTNVNVIQ